MTHQIGHMDEDGEGCCEPIIRALCLCGRARYATEREAGRDAKRMRYQGRGHGYKGLLRPYQCPERKGVWHVGHKGE